MTEDIDKAALDYHRNPRPGKIEVVATKDLSNQRDLSLAYSPGVAAACRAIVDDPAEAETLTSRGNLVAVISNGTAVLGLGAIGALASKPVMEGKGVLFKKFAGIDVFDIEIDERDPDKFCDIVAALEPTFGGVNLEDIKAPECFVIEDALRERMNIPVFHDDQHGTAICVAAAVYNALRVVGKRIEDVRLVCSGAGAAAMACLNLLHDMGLDRSRVLVADIDGVLHAGRAGDMHPRQAMYCHETEARTLGEAIVGADIFLGLSAPGVLKPEMVDTMAQRPIIMALANPVPEILPDLAREVRPDAVIGTGRSDYPNQINNVLCFPFLFRGALDVGATVINEAMKIAAVKALADLAMKTATSDVVAQAYAGAQLQFGAEYLLPKPFDPRLISEIPPAVAKAAMDSGVATRPIADLEAYAEDLEQHVYKSGLAMKPIYETARDYEDARVIFADGEEPKVLRTVQIALDEDLCRPILVGRKAVIEQRIERLGLSYGFSDPRLDCIDPNDDPRYRQYWTEYQQIMGRNGVTPEDARRVVRTRPTVIAALAVRLGDAEAMICGVNGRFQSRMSYIQDIVGLKPGVTKPYTLMMMIMPKRVVFIADSNVTVDPTAEDVAEMTCLAAERVATFGYEPRAALLSHSNFGRLNTPTALKMRRAVDLIRERQPALMVDGEMHGDAAIYQDIRDDILPDSVLKGSANLLIMPSLDAANISINLLKSLGEGLAVGPMPLGVDGPAYVANNSITVRGLTNMTALAVADAARLRIAAAAPGA